MRQRQFRLRTLLIAVTILCVHLGIGAASLSVLFAVLLFSIPATILFVARWILGATMARSAIAAVILGPCFTTMLFVGIWLAAESLPVPRLPFSARLAQSVFAAVFFAVFGFLSSTWVTAIWWAAHASHTMLHDRTDRYYAKDE
jgi:hypothetical protein